MKAVKSVMGSRVQKRVKSGEGFDSKVWVKKMSGMVVQCTYGIKYSQVRKNKLEKSRKWEAE